MSVPAVEVVLGNTAAVETPKIQVFNDSGELQEEVQLRNDRSDLGNTITRFSFPRDYAQPDLDWIRPDDARHARRRGLPKGQQKWYLHLVAIEDAWYSSHSDDPPEFVECDDKDLAELIAGVFSTHVHTCAVGRPDDWKEGKVSKGIEEARALEVEGRKANGGPDGPPRRESEHHDDSPWGIFGDPLELWHHVHARFLKTNGGVDAIHRQIADTAAQPAASNYIAVTANATAPAASDTTLTGEIVTAGGGLLRAQAAFAHTNGTATSTLTKTFTANGSDSLPVTLAKIGVFNASSAGTMTFTTLLNATATLTISGDNVTITDTITTT